MSLAHQEYRHAPPTKVTTIAAVAVTAGTAVSIWTPAVGSKFRLIGYSLSLTVAGSVILKDNTTEVLRTGLLAANTAQISPPLANGYLSSATNNSLMMDVSATGSVSGFVYGFEEV